ncbi:transcriptional regulator, AraC family [Methylobacillus rhizosphaerae]|uniref:Transcriptional regulator, AraC family n=1 Tax=Methylobacillus rhizosphaerae TaxID=551994 RepID=A0A238XUF0_9PROT|nr:helix-turn-helix transcriptional regulator [Methylobacillus rhizosphaerae]SNR62342.1 transcriptional regulator, AraC family [Methylobacillus rhizosphaerae]
MPDTRIHPVFTDLNGVGPDPDQSLLPVVARVGTYSKGWQVETHAHRRGQLMFIISGSMRVETRDGSWITPPGRACWIPAAAIHGVTYAQASEMRTVLIAPELLAPLPRHCCVIKLTPLLRELVLQAVAIDNQYSLNSAEHRLMQVLIDQIGMAQQAPLFLPEGRDARLRKVTESLHHNPGDDRNIEQWASVAGASTRTLARLFVKETGLTFSAWRQQLCLIRAVEMLIDGQSVTNTAIALGYESTAGFTSMFSRTMGESPSNYQTRWSQAQA